MTIAVDRDVIKHQTKNEFVGRIGSVLVSDFFLFFYFFFFFDSVLRPFHIETNQSVGGAPASRTWLVSHMNSCPVRGANQHR